jgi:hypothetical protein
MIRRRKLWVPAAAALLCVAAVRLLAEASLSAPEGLRVTRKILPGGEGLSPTFTFPRTSSTPPPGGCSP